jgi:hypothetical protein
MRIPFASQNKQQHYPNMLIAELCNGVEVFLLEVRIEFLKKIDGTCPLKG